jgi:ABC-type multidrug transport system ATPase subunit
VEGVTSDVAPGEIFGSWAERRGKTTTLRMVAGLIAPTSGGRRWRAPLTRQTIDGPQPGGLPAGGPGLWDA